MSRENRQAGEADKLAAIISDEEIARVHGHANFGTMTPREVVNDGVRKSVVGYHCGHTQFTILREHGLITKPRGFSYDVNLTKKGRKYASALLYRPLFGSPASDLEQVSRERDEAVRLLRPFAEGAHLGAVGGRPPWEFVSANDYEAARAFLNNLDNRNG